MEFDLSIIIPSYNEITTISVVLKKINSLPFASKIEVIVIDDGSEDGTYEYLNTISDTFQYKLIVLKNSENKGKGAAIRMGIIYASGKYLIVQDADMEYDPSNITVIYEKLLHSGCDAVYGSRLLSDNEIFNKFYLYGNILLTFLINFLFGSRYTDSYTGYKAF
ncbi:MAG: glycosyltransferase family 2 protein [Elusimicrobiota bacterium]